MAFDPRPMAVEASWLATVPEPEAKEELPSALVPLPSAVDEGPAARAPAPMAAARVPEATLSAPIAVENWPLAVQSYQQLLGQDAEHKVRWKPELAKKIVKSGKHEALADIHESIEELKFYRDNFLKL